MPQKKNPDPLEYLRGKSGNAYGNLFSMFTILKGLPLSYFKDLQDDKNLIFKSFDDLINARRFSAIIYREENVRQNRDISSYITKNAFMRLLESERIKEKIRNFEHDMWSW